ncbi:B-cell lymphoma/leukemia 10-like [Ylistrum balloti]|uniref:B-cell lymphoma/leukemia 10-like n=1 Tax=Ylistrum balloti TaxID=509963 RepID=UPI002905BF19|nr:B-cell lymphoma/leukemia 10-like [Ylistrum balloti]
MKMGTPTEDEVLAGIKRLILEEKRDILCRYMNPERYFDYLRSKFVINEEDKEEIEFEKTRRKKASVMIDIILKKGGDAYDIFVKAIQADRTQTHLVNLLHEEYEKRKNNYFALVKKQPVTTAPINDQFLPRPPPPPPMAGLCSDENNQRDCQVLPPPTTTAPLNTQARTNNKPSPLLVGPPVSDGRARTEAPPEPLVPSSVRTENRIPSVVHATTCRHTPSSTNQSADTESTKDQKDQTNRHKLKFTSRSADHADIDEETHRKEVFSREGEEHTESVKTESDSSSEFSSESTKPKE